MVIQAFNIGLPKKELELFIKHKKYKEIAASWRGKVLSHAVDFEICLDNFLAAYFGGKYKIKRENFLILVNSEILLSRKIKICNKIFKGKKDKTEYDFKRVSRYMEDIRKLRNVVAHSDINSVGFVNNLKKNTTVFKYKDDKGNLYSISDKSFDRFFMDTLYCIDFFIANTSLICKPLPNKKS